MKYRKSVITANLKSSLSIPDEQEMKQKVSLYYAYLAKTLRQIVVSPTRKLLLKKMQLAECPELTQWLAAEKSVLITFGHLGNWEWAGSFIGLHYPDQVCALYKKIKSPYFNSLMMRRRLTHVNHLVEIGQIGELLRLIRKKPVLILMIADQNPGSDQGIIWAPFFGKETAFVNGPENLALRYHLPVVYLEINSKPEGQYDLKCHTLYDGISPMAPGEITHRFATQLEQNIRNNGMEWLWSHKRWKRNKV